MEPGRARAFVKAVGPGPNPDSAGLHRSEARTMAVLPCSAAALRMLWSLDRDGWVALAFEDAATAMLAAVAGYPVANSCLPAPPGLPTLRSFQLGQGLAALDWLRRRTGWR